MYRRPAMTKWLRAPSAPLVLLTVLSLLSLAARVAWLGEPCRDPCRSHADHLLVFDESYYVNAARVIAGLPPPANENYADARLGDDPNAEHPQLAKLLIAGSIELLGDRPIGWRLTPLVLGTVAILGMYALARAAGAGAWVALGAASLMAADSLLLIHGRIATLDVPVVAAMIWAAVAYLRGRPLLAGVLVGVGTAIKLVAPYVLVAFVLLELFRRRGARVAGDGVRAAARLGGCTAVSAGVFVGLLAILDLIAPPYDSTSTMLLASGPFHHIAHMLSYGADQTSPHGPTGIASYPWTWLVDVNPITYLNVNPSRPAPGLYNVHPAVHFIGMMSPSIMLLAIPALASAAWTIVRPRAPRLAAAGADVGAGAARRFASGEVALLAVAWFLGTFLPFVVLSLAFNRTSYIYYMVIVMPGIYLAVADLVVRGRRFRKLIVLWVVLVVGAATVMYPLTPLP
jgi:predicted membrane-bound dolichyl-phosphate-mannose-protein mannosyltransferase